MHHISKAIHIKEDTISILYDNLSLEQYQQIPVNTLYLDCSIYIVINLSSVKTGGHWRRGTQLILMIFLYI